MKWKIGGGGRGRIYEAESAGEALMKWANDNPEDIHLTVIARPYYEAGTIEDKIAVLLWEQYILDTEPDWDREDRLDDEQFRSLLTETERQKWRDLAAKCIRIVKEHS